MKHKILFFFYLLLFSVTSMHAENWGDDVEAVTPITYLANGFKTNVYRIATPQQLAYMAQGLNNKTITGTTITGTTVIVLENDIDLAGKDWIPMNPSIAIYFRGNNHAIKNLTISDTQELRDVGLFGNTSDTKAIDIADVRLTGVNISVNEKTYYAGALAGHIAYKSTIVNCHAEGKITSALTTNSTGRTQGGLIGHSNDCTLDRSSAAMEQSLSGSSIIKESLACLIGGLVGRIDGAKTQGTTIVNCHSGGKINIAEGIKSCTFYALNIGGFGNTSVDNGLPGSITNCYSTCDITHSGTPTIKNSGKPNIGGFLGGVCSLSLKVSNCFSTGKIAITTAIPSNDIKKLNIGTLFGSTRLATTGTLTCDNNFYPQGTTAIGKDEASIQTGITEIEESTLLADLNTWVDNTNGNYLPWKKENTDYTFQVDKPVEGTDYAWNGDVCTLKTTAGLRWFAQQVLSFNNFANKTIQLEEKGDASYWDVSKPDWIPMGYSKNSGPTFGFSGIFDGKGQEVKYKMSQQSTNGRVNGFFAYIENGTVQNLTVNGDIQNEGNKQGISNAGIVVAQMKGGSLINVVSKGTQNSPQGGGIAGIVGNGEDITITDCSNEAAVTGKQYCGGIIGNVGTGVVLANCLNTGAITVTMQVCGGIAGYAQPSEADPISFKNCRNEGVITGKAFCGGIIGALKYGEVIDCVNSGSVTGTQAVGGIVGDCDIQTTINGCSNSGKIESKASNTTMTGGIAGRVYSNTEPTPSSKAVNSLTPEIVIINSNNTGAISVPNGMCAGGIAGLANSKTTNIYIINCGNYADISGTQYVSGIATAQSSAAGVQTIIRNCISSGSVAATAVSSSLVSYSTGTSGGVIVDHCFYKEQTDVDPVKSSSGNINLTTKDIIAISDNLDSHLNDLNQGATDFNNENQNLPSANGWKTNTDQGALEHTILPPVIEGETDFETETTVSIQATAGATIYYTTDGDTPTNGSDTYTEALLLTTTTTVKAIAVLNGKESAVTEKVFTKKKPVIPTPPYIPTYLKVILPEIQGATTTPKAGNYIVEEGYSFSFALILAAGYESSQPIVKANGKIITPRESDGKYIIRNIITDMNITIEGIDNPTGNIPIAGKDKVKVQAVGSSLYIHLPKAEKLYIYTLSGLLYGEHELPAGDSKIQLTTGVYFVKVGDETYKVVV